MIESTSRPYRFDIDKFLVLEAQSEAQAFHIMPFREMIVEQLEVQLMMWYNEIGHTYENEENFEEIVKKEIAENGGKVPFVVPFKDNKRMSSINEITNDNYTSVNNTFYPENGYYFRIQVAASYQKPFPMYKLEYQYGLEEYQISEEKMPPRA